MAKSAETNPGAGSVESTLLRLYPDPAEPVALTGCYLQLGLHRFGTPQAPFVYANFLSSLDGRIALAASDGRPYLPRSLTNANDFRLFLELHCQADCLITHGSYLKELAAGRLGNILQVGLHEQGKQLSGWRSLQGLPDQPAVVIASASLDFPPPRAFLQPEQACYIATGQQARAERVAYWQDQGYPVLVAGTRREVEGGLLMDALGRLGYGRAYLIAGPGMLETMLRDGCLSRLFHTTTHQLLGGTDFRSLSPGPEYGRLGHLRLLSLHYDSSSPAGAGQCFAQFEPLK
jgi:riboflavin biosynthesis pyrimidine reductase